MSNISSRFKSKPPSSSSSPPAARTSMEGADADADADDVVLLAVEIPKEGRVEEGANAEAVDANARRAMEICIVLM
jgi:hypothetical protein